MNSGMEIIASPELVECVNRGSPERFKMVNRYKNDVFALGATIMELGLLKPLNKLITEDKHFDTNQLTSYFKQFQNEYKSNKLLVSMVKSMINVNPIERPTFIGKALTNLTKRSHFLSPDPQSNYCAFGSRA